MYRRYFQFLVLIIILIFTLPSAIPLYAQGECSLPARLKPNLPGRVRGISTAGNNLRSSAGLAGEIIQQLPNQMEFIVQSGPNCVDGLNWYEIKTLDEISGWTAEGSDGLYWVEPTPFCTARQQTAGLNYLLDKKTDTFFDRVVKVEYFPERKSLLIASQPENRQEQPHPALLDYHWLNLETLAITLAAYPDADIVTPALTDKLGITEYVFGDKSQPLESLHVSPRRDRILYFVHTPPVSAQDGCTEYCSFIDVWVANKDGSNATYLDSIPNAGIGYFAWDWSSKGKIYLSMVYADGTVGILELCEDGSCSRRDSFPFTYEFPSVSPDGNYITFVVDPYAIKDKIKLFEYETGKWFDLPLLSSQSPAIWSDDGLTIYYFARIDDEVVFASTPLNDLSQAKILVPNAPAGYSYYPLWDVAPDMGLLFTIRSDELHIYCMQE
jgi:hypothetical protein